MHESHFKRFIEHLVGVREIFKFKHKQDGLRSRQNQLGILATNHNFIYKLTIGTQIKTINYKTSK